MVTRSHGLNNKYGRLGPLRSEAAVQRVLEEDSVLGQRMLEVQSRLEQLAWREGEEREGRRGLQGHPVLSTEEVQKCVVITEVQWKVKTRVARTMALIGRPKTQHTWTTLEANQIFRDQRDIRKFPVWQHLRNCEQCANFTKVSRFLCIGTM